MTIRTNMTHISNIDEMRKLTEKLDDSCKVRLIVDGTEHTMSFNEIAYSTKKIAFGISCGHSSLNVETVGDLRDYTDHLDGRYTIDFVTMTELSEYEQMMGDRLFQIPYRIDVNHGLNCNVEGNELLITIR